MHKGQEMLKKPLQYLKGVGEARAALFKRLGIHTVGDVISHYPRDYEDRSRLKKLIRLEDGDQCSFEGIIASRVVVSKPRRGLTVSKVSIRDDTGLINAIWFNKPYLKDQLRPGERYLFFGKITKRGTFEILNPVYEKMDETGPVNTCRIIPVYPSTGKLTQNVIRSVIRNALSYAADSIEDILPGWISERYGLADARYSISNIHFPESDDAFMKARKRLVFEELLILQLALMSVRTVQESDLSGIAFGAREEVRRFIEGLPFRLTNAQLRVLEEIERDMESSRIMNRLVQGDVGSGKTIVAVAALVKAVKSGYQGAFMVPTEILAAQHYSSLKELLEPLGINMPC